MPPILKNESTAILKIQIQPKANKQKGRNNS